MNTVDLGHGRGWLEADAAASILRIDRELGHPLQITEAGRTWERQNEHFQHYLEFGSPIALDPDTPSVHQEGEAIDSDEAQDHISLMERHGWYRTVYRNKKLIERWHFERFADRDQHRNDPPPTTQVPEEDDMRAITKDGAANTGIIIQPGVPPYSIPQQTFEALCSVYGLEPLAVPAYKYDTVVREHWTAFSTSQAFAANRSLTQADIDKIAAKIRDALPKANS